MKHALYAIPLALAMTACASSGPHYMAADEPGDYGYYDRVLEPNRYRVAYKVRGDDIEASKDYALLRAAELTMEHGQDWFQIVDRQTDAEQGRSRTHVHGSLTASNTVYRECGVLTCRTVVAPTYMEPVFVETEPSSAKSTVTFIEIRMGSGRMPKDGNVYDARTLASTLRART